MTEALVKIFIRRNALRLLAPYSLLAAYYQILQITEQFLRLSMRYLAPMTRAVPHCPSSRILPRSVPCLPQGWPDVTQVVAQVDAFARRDIHRGAGCK